MCAFVVVFVRGSSVAVCAAGCEHLWLSVHCSAMAWWRVPVQLDVAAVLDALAAQGCEEDRLDALGERIGFADTVTVEQLAATGFTNRVVFDLRRRLDSHFAIVEVCRLRKNTAELVWNLQLASFLGRRRSLVVQAGCIARGRVSWEV